jgi:hypothetical protein
MREFFGNSLGILWEFFGNSLGFLWGCMVLHLTGYSLLSNGKFQEMFWPIPPIADVFYGRPLFGILLLIDLWLPTQAFFVKADGFVNFSQNFCSDMGGVLGKNWTLSQTNWHTPDMLSVADWLDYYRINQRISSTFPPWVCFMFALN